MNQSQLKDEYQHIDERISSIYDGEYFRIIQRKGDILIVNCEIVFVWMHNLNSIYKLRCNALLVGQMHPSYVHPDEAMEIYSNIFNGAIANYWQKFEWKKI